MSLSGPDGVIPYHQSKAGWSLKNNSILLRLPAHTPAPDANNYHLIHADSTDQENARSLAWSAERGADFALRDVRTDSGTQHGILLPAPAQAAFTVDLFDGAVLELVVTVLQPLILDDEASDGAALKVRLVHDDQSHDLGRASVLPGDARRLRLALPRGLSGSGVIILESLAVGTSALDYVFVAAPTLYRPTQDPKRLVMIFIDTLRPDHLGLYGYERDTSPELDEWARGAAVFEQARSIAPWTLPSARSALSGMQPEHWHDVSSLPERLSEAGFTTVGVVSNAFLSATLGMNRGFDVFIDHHLGSAQTQVSATLEAMETHSDRDLAVMVHLMDPHLPYEEPEAYRGLWAGESPLPNRFGRTRLVKQSPEDTALHQYVIDRYDQNIRYADASLGPLLEVLDEDDMVVVFSDHGEEFWEHGSVEHGHTLYDEVIQIPLLLSAPGIPAGRHTAPVSLLDLTPTLLDLLGLPTDGLQGRSLVPLMHDSPGADQALRDRPQAFGRTLYGRTMWGSLTGSTKRIRKADALLSFDLQTDPEEADPGLAQGSEVQSQMAQALARAVPTVWRLEARGSTKKSRIRGELILTHPDGFQDAWKAYDPHNRYADPVVEDGAVRVAATDELAMPAEVFLLPNSTDPAGLSVVQQLGEKQRASVAGEGSVLQVLYTSSGLAQIVTDFAPLPVAGDSEMLFPASLEAELRELGYLE